MEVKQARQVLAYHNHWRKGADIGMIDPKLLGEAINKAIEVMIKEETR